MVLVQLLHGGVEAAVVVVEVGEGVDVGLELPGPLRNLPQHVGPSPGDLVHKALLVKAEGPQGQQ